MKKRILALLAASTLVIGLLAGCAGGRGTDTPPAEAPPAETPVDTPPAETPADTGLTTDNITLIAWESEGAEGEWIRQAGEAFTAKHPNITIDLQNVELGDTTTRIALDGPAGIGADVFAAPHDRLGELVSGGHILPVADPAAVTQYVQPGLAAGVSSGGTLYGVPISSETYALYFNRALIAEEDVPTTWEDLLAMEKDFQALDGSNARLFIMDVANAYYTILFSMSADNRLFGPNGDDPSQPNMNTEASIRGFEFFQSLRQYIDIAAEDLGTEAADAQFAGGSAAMHISGPWNISSFTDDGIDFGVTTLPALPGDTTPATSFAGARTAFVSAYTQHEAEAQAFAAFLVTPEMQQLRFDLTGALPSTGLQIDDAILQGFVNQLNTAFLMPSIPQMGTFWDAMNAASANIWNGADVTTELNTLQEALLNAGN